LLLVPALWLNSKLILAQVHLSNCVKIFKLVSLRSKTLLKS
jgi:hypothetical protein